MPGRQGSSCASLCGGPAGGIIARPPAARKRQPVGAYPVTLRPGGWGSRCAPRQWSGRRRPQNSSARGSEKATRWGFPADAVARQAGESLCASSVVRKAAEPAKNRPPAARPECMPGGNRRPQPLPWQTVGVYPVALRSEGGRVIVVSLGPVGLCPSAVRPECVPGGNRRPQPLLRQPVRERTAVAHGADSSERSPAKIARP